LLLWIHSDGREESLNGKKYGINGEEWIVRVRYRMENEKENEREGSVKDGTNGVKLDEK
jgi:hypothetical protein